MFSLVTTNVSFIEALTADDSRNMRNHALRLLATGDGHWLLRKVSGGDDAMCVPATANAHAPDLDDLQPCSGSTDQQWSLVAAAPGTYQLVSRASGDCLTRSGGAAFLQSCGTGDDEFQLVPVMDRWLSFRAPDGKALTLSLDPNSPEAQTRDFSGAGMQVFTISPSAGHALDFQIRLAHSSLDGSYCIDIETASLVAGCSGRSDPRLRFVPTGDGTYLIKNPVTGSCLVSRPGGGVVYHEACDASSNWQHWTMAPLGMP